jgi:LacI family transcriptional regulator
MAQDSGYWELPKRGMTRAVEELARYRISVSFYHFDRYAETAVADVIRQVSTGDFDAVLVAPVHPVLAGLITHCDAGGLPYAFFDSTLPDTQPVTVIGQDAHRSGMLAGHLMSMIVQRPGRVLVFRIHPQDRHIVERARGFTDFLAEDTRLKPVVVDVEVPSVPGAFEGFLAAPEAGRDGYCGVFVTTAAAHLVAEFLARSQPESRPHLIGYDVVGPNIRWLENGGIDFLISQRPELQGYQGIYSLFQRVVLKETVEPSVLMPIDIITRENLEG